MNKIKFPDYLPFNPYKLKKAELQIFLTGYCRHKHRYTEHPNCFVKEVLEKNGSFIRGFLDIEASNLAADFGIILSYAIKVDGKKKIYADILTKKDLDSGVLDRRLLENLLNDLKNFDEIVTYYGTRFDIPFIRSRYLYWKQRDKKFAKLQFPYYGYIKHKDVYYMAKNRLKIHRNRLEDVCRLLKIKGKTHFDGEHWVKSLTGNKKSLNYILDHNIKDVIILEKVYHELEPFVRQTNRSI